MGQLSSYEGLGFGWMLLVVGGFAAGFLLTKISLLTEKNTAAFCTVVTTVVAGIVAYLSEPSGSHGVVVSILLRTGPFMLAWIAFGVVFTLGVAWGQEKAKKKTSLR